MNQRKFLITADGSHTIFLPDLNETYHSTNGAIQESQHVFIDQGLKFFLEQNPDKEVNLFEVGFGTGLNALLAALFAESQKVKTRYTTIEAFPLSSDEIGRLNYPELLIEESTIGIFGKIHECDWESWKDINSNFRLKKVNAAIQEFRVPSADICFFDAFAPSKQPEMWEKNILENIYDSLAKNGILVTYCAQGQFKRNLKSLGFEVETPDGPSGKKEMVRAIKN